MTTRRKRRAWVLQRGWAGDHAVELYPWIAEQPIAAILSPRLGPAKVQLLTERSHDAVMLDPIDMFDDLQQGRSTYAVTPVKPLGLALRSVVERPSRQIDLSNGCGRRRVREVQPPQLSSPATR